LVVVVVVVDVDVDVGVEGEEIYFGRRRSRCAEGSEVLIYGGPRGVGWFLCE